MYPPYKIISFSEFIITLSLRCFIISSLTEEGDAMDSDNEEEEDEDEHTKPRVGGVSRSKDRKERNRIHAKLTRGW